MIQLQYCPRGFVTALRKTYKTVYDVLDSNNLLTQVYNIEYKGKQQTQMQEQIKSKCDSS